MVNVKAVPSCQDDLHYHFTKSFLRFHQDGALAELFAAESEPAIK